MIKISKKKIVFPKNINIFLVILFFGMFGVLNLANADIPCLLAACDARSLILYIISNLKLIVVGIAVVVLILGGITYLVSGSNVRLAEKAKLTILGAVLGFAIVIGADILINQVGCALGWKGVESCGEGQSVVARLITFLFSILGAIGLGGILVGSMFYFAAVGDEEKMKQGRKIVIYSIIGIIIALSATIIIRQIERIIIQ
ncbi:MAG: hypothetical protein V1690_00020 [Candidatus Moraniibacteriota bacterium]